jgi:hypothetical protein
LAALIVGAAKPRIAKPAAAKAKLRMGVSPYLLIFSCASTIDLRRNRSMNRLSV